MTNRKIVTAQDLRGVLLATIEGVLEGRVNTSQANQVAQLSAEFHKSLRQEWDMKVYANENLTIEHGRLVRLIDGEPDAD
jgi:hypothetical protein